MDHIKNAERQIQFFASLGPLIALATIFITLESSSLPSTYLPFITLVSLIGCWKWRMQGLVVSLCLLILSIGYQYTQLPKDSFFWLLGAGLSIALSLVITTLSFDELTNILSLFQKKFNHYLEENQNTKEQEITILNLQIATLIAEQRNLLEELTTLKSKPNEPDEPNQSDEPKPIDKSENLQSTVQALKCTQGKLEQLKEQFAEKSLVLDQTRQELFQTNEALTRCQLELNEKEKNMTAEVARALEKQLALSEKELKEMEQINQKHQLEIQVLETWITSLLKP